ncbi:MAG: filamentous hemagglutinin N-terminal domain-containing protein [Cyanobacteria bacterium P01_A01_bin.135]
MVASLRLAAILLCLGFSQTALAQVIPDRTLGPESSRVTRGVVIRGNRAARIEGGARRSRNLFHSFSAFTIGSRQRVYFASPAGVETIISRVTGRGASNLDGTLGVLGDANLFLLNPNGIVFGPNARLDVAGSFVGTTATAIEFGDQGQFGAAQADVNLPLLTVQPSAFFFTGPVNRPITIEATPTLEDPANGLEAAAGQSLLLLGGPMTLASGRLNASQGQIELGAIASPGRVPLSTAQDSLRIAVPGGAKLADITLTDFAAVTAAEGGSVSLFGRRVAVSGGSRIAISAGRSGGSLQINASERIHLSGAAFGSFPSGLSAVTTGDGDGGLVDLTTDRLVVEAGAQVLASTTGEGSGGRLRVEAQSVVVAGGVTGSDIVSGLVSESRGSGDGGDITITADRLTLREGGAISTSARAGSSGAAGDLTLRTRSTRLLGTLPGSPDLRSGLFSVTRGGRGRAGRIRIEAENLAVRGGAVVTASTFDGAQGRGGDIQIRASEAVEVTGTAPNGQVESALLVGTSTPSAAGNLRIATPRLLVGEGALVSARSFSIGAGGDIAVSADVVAIRGGARMTVSGEAGDVESVSTTTAGDLRIESSAIALADGGTIEATTLSGDGGNLTLQAESILSLSDRSRISTTAGSAQSGGDGGNISITSPWVVADALGNSDITANAFTGSGGRVQLTATEGVLGLVPRSRQALAELLDPDNLDPSRLQSSDITAISQTNPRLDGQIILDTPRVEPEQQAADLPEALAAPRLQQRCYASAATTSSFVNAGRGGLPPSPAQANSSLTLWDDLRSLPDRSTAGVMLDTPQTKPLVEAQGWAVASDGTVVLTAQPTPEARTWATAALSAAAPCRSF